MIAAHVGADGDTEDTVAVHHFLVAMAIQANLGVEFTINVTVRVAELLNFVQTVTIVTGGRV